MGRRPGSAGHWVHGRIVRAIVAALADAPSHVVTATLAAATGAPVRLTDADRKLVAVTLVKRALPAIKEAERPTRVLARLVDDLADHVDSEAFEPTAEDVGFLRATHGAWPAAAYLLLRAGARGEKRRERPTYEQIAKLVKAMQQRQWDAKQRQRRT